MSKKTLIGFIFVFFGLITALFPQSSYFQQEVNSFISVELDDVNHELHGDISIEYINQSPDILEFVFIHLWANAYQDQSTAFAKQQLKNNDTKFHFSSQEDKGNFTGIDFTVDGKKATFEYWKSNKDIVKVYLNKTLNPGESILINTPLHLKIPSSFSRLGHVGTSYQMTQWFPKPAVYDRDGWHPMPYLTQGEFYSEFGSYDVSITLPKNYYVAATGTLETNAEWAFRQKRIEETIAMKSDTSRVKDVSFPESSDEMKTVKFKAENVHDFGWFADKRFWIEKSSVSLKNNRNIDTWVFYTDDEKDLWSKGIEYVDRSVKFYSEHVGDYPYPQATAVQSALSAGGGMEYPMITVIGLSGNALSLDQVITHEVGHNWFYGILGFNERDHPWLDEGINSYYDHRYTDIYYENSKLHGAPKFLRNRLETSLFQAALMAQIRRGKDQASNLHSEDFGMLNYGIGAYEKPALAFEYLSRYIGVQEFDKIMKSFYADWAFKHPGPDDLISHFNANTKKDLSWFWDGIIGSSDEVNYAIKKIDKGGEDLTLNIKNLGQIQSPYSISAFQNEKAVYTEWYEGNDKNTKITIPKGDYDYIMLDSSFLMLDYNMNNNYKKFDGVNLPKIGFFTGYDISKKRQAFLLPALGGNEYDGIMLGLNAHNLTLPMPRLKASITSMYGFNSKKIVGNAYLAYDQAIKGKKLQSITYSLFSKNFSLKTKVTGPDLIQTPQTYGTIVPAIRFHFQDNKNSPISSDLILKNTFVQIRNFDTNDAVDEKYDNSYTQLIYDLKKRHSILPMGVTTTLEYQSFTSQFLEKEKSVRLDLEYNMSYQYKAGRNIDFRIFMAGFPYHTESKSTSSSSNNISLIHNGKADYRFEDYYFGREEQLGFSGSQVMVKSGGFKVPAATPFPFAESDRFAFSSNLVIDLPINKIGKFVGLYADFGAFSNKPFASDPYQMDYMYSGGVRLNLYDFIQVYLPIFNSDNILSTYGEKYFSRVSFTFDLNKYEPIELYRSFEI